MKHCLSEEDREYLLTLYKQYERLIKNTIIHCLTYKGSYDVEDALMDVFYIACYKIEKLKDSPNPAGWLVNTAKNVAANQSRKYFVIDKHNYTDENGLKYVSCSFEETLLDDITFETWMNNKAVDSIKSLLSETELILYKLRFEEHKSITEISKILTKSEGSIKTAVSRLKKHINNIVISGEFEKKHKKSVTHKSKRHIHREEVNRENKQKHNIL